MVADGYRGRYHSGRAASRLSDAAPRWLQAGDAIPGVRIAKLFGTRAHAILNELGFYHYHI
eukprot:2586759-Pleurochrysis_carterae.AAC.3